MLIAHPRLDKQILEREIEILNRQMDMKNDNGR